MRIGFQELLVIALIIFLLFGPEALPRIARQAGVFLRRLNKEIRSFDPDSDSGADSETDTQQEPKRIK